MHILKVHLHQAVGIPQEAVDSHSHQQERVAERRKRNLGLLEGDSLLCPEVDIAVDYMDSF